MKKSIVFKWFVLTALLFSAMVFFEFTNLTDGLSFLLIMFGLEGSEQILHS